MKALILAAGYGTRLQRDLKNDESGNYKQLLNVPKPLLPIGSLPLSSHLMKMLNKTSNKIDKVYLVCNKFYHNQFLQWAEEWPDLEIICDGSLSNEDRPGAVGCISLAINSASIQDDLLVLGGDTLFHEDFKIEEFIDCFERQSKKGSAGLVTTVICTDEDTWKTGIVEVEEDGKISSFLEKVGPEATSSRLSVPCFYLLSKSSLHQIGNFLEETKT
ncbi:mannose-1-phosphate guanylyltransferase catalytic subunit beta-like isoform X2 [Apostichopus japonicus]|uniref:mannose-1-phosphate guanylyltransferase catalytic subunit beta-like isoform X2 n=1 Tax=Stichopus japonicus TaxID=307972 RepID=UPI003AB84CC1